MPKDPKRNIQSYQIQGGHLNEFEFQKRQGEIAEEAELPFTVDADQPSLTQAERLAAVTAEAHRKVEKRKKLGLSRPESQKSVPTKKGSPKKVARKSIKRGTSTKKTTKRASTKVSKVKSRPRKLPAKS